MQGCERRAHRHCLGLTPALDSTRAQASLGRTGPQATRGKLLPRSQARADSARDPNDSSGAGPAHRKPRPFPACPAPGRPGPRTGSRPLIGCGRGGGGPGRRAADSRWRRPGGGVPPSAEGHVRGAAPAGGPRHRGPSRRRLPGRSGGGRGVARCRVPSLCRPPPSCAAALRRPRPSPREAPHGAPGSCGTDASRLPLCLHPLPPVASLARPPRQLSRPGRQSGGRGPTPAHARHGPRDPPEVPPTRRKLLGGAPPRPPPSARANEQGRKTSGRSVIGRF